MAYLDGHYGGDNLVNQQAVKWIQKAIEDRGNPVEVLWVDAAARMNEWKFPDEVRAAMAQRSDDQPLV